MATNRKGRTRKPKGKQGLAGVTATERKRSRLFKGVQGSKRGSGSRRGVRKAGDAIKDTNATKKYVGPGDGSILRQFTPKKDDQTPKTQAQVKSEAQSKKAEAAKKSAATRKGLKDRLASSVKKAKIKPKAAKEQKAAKKSDIKGISLTDRIAEAKYKKYAKKGKDTKAAAEKALDEGKLGKAKRLSRKAGRKFGRARRKEERASWRAQNGSWNSTCRS